MDIRIQQALDGELARDELSEAEGVVLAEAEAAIAGVLQRIPTRPLPALAPEVMRRISEIPRRRPVSARLHQALEWFWQPHPIAVRWRPAYALPMVAALGFFLWLDRGQPEPMTAAPAQVLIEFRLSAPQASHVALAGDFTNWKPTYTLVRGEPGVWTIVVPLEPGVHDYAFIVDGDRWIADPMAPAVADGFGGLNSRIAVLPPDLAIGT